MNKKMVKWKNLLVIISISLIVDCESQLTTELRLPRKIRPLHYEINLETVVHDGGNRDYGGEVKIDLNVLEATNEIVLHHRGLSINFVTLFDANDNFQFTIQNTSYSNDTEFLTIRSSLIINQGTRLRLQIEFNGKLQTGTAGFYRSQYQVPGENLPR